MKHLTWLLAALIFLLTLAGLLFEFPAGLLLIRWGSFLASVALILGALNLFVTHLRRIVKGNVYSTVLVLGMILVWLAPLMDSMSLSEKLGLTQDWATTLFNFVQRPLEAAVGALMLFFLLFAGIRLFQRTEDRLWTVFFAAGGLIVLLGTASLPSNLGGIFEPIQQFVDNVIVNAGVRGILIGIALATITLSLRLLAGVERPYNK
jgi:hypothetical protein